MPSNAYITLDLQGSDLPVVYAKQSDRRTRRVIAQLRDGGVAYVPATGAAVTIRYRKPDGTAGFYDTLENGSIAYSVSGSVLTFTMVEQMLTVPGDVYGEINFYSSGGYRTTTFTFLVRVQTSVLSDAEIISSDYFNALTAQASRAVNAAAAAEASASSAAAAVAGVGYKLYRSVTDLGQESGSATIAGAYAAMPNYSVLITNAGGFSSSEVPTVYGVVLIVKFTTARGMIKFFTRNTSTSLSYSDYRMFTDSSGVPTGVWVPSGGVIYKDYTVTLTANAYVSPFGYYGDLNVSPPAGLSIVSAVGVGGSDGVILAQASSGKYIYVYGHAAGDVTVRVGFGVTN